MTATQHPAAPHHLPWFIAPPPETDFLFAITTVVVIGTVLGLGILFFRLHSLPERLGHKKFQFEIVAVLGLLSLFTHVHAGAYRSAGFPDAASAHSDVAGKIVRNSNPAGGACAGTQATAA